MIAELRAIMAINNTSHKRLGEVTGCKPTSLTHKLQGKTDFKLNEIREIIKFYNLSPEQIYSIFIKEE